MTTTMKTGLTDEQMAQRAQGVGASEAADIVHGRWYKIWLRKTGQAPPEEDSVDAIFGRLMEAPVLQWYAEEGDGAVAHVGYAGTASMPGHPRVLATPDALGYDDPDGPPSCVVEIKCPRSGDEWGACGSTHIPDRYWWQVQQQMAVCGVDTAHVVALIWRDIRVYKIPRNDEAIGLLVTEIEHFWRAHVEAGVAPPVDGSDQCHDHLARRFPRSEDRTWLEDETFGELAAAHERAHQRKKDAAEECSMLRAQIKARIGTAYGARGVWGRATWSPNKGALKVDYPSAVVDLLGQFGVLGQSAAEHTEALLKKHTKRGAGHDSLRITLSREDAE